MSDNQESLRSQYRGSCQEFSHESEDLQASRLSVLSKNSQIDQHLNQDEKSPHQMEAENCANVAEFTSGA